MYFKNTISTALSQISKLILKFIVSILVARTLGATEYGKVTYFLLVIGLISSYGHFGANNAVTYFAKKDRLDVKDQLSTNITFLLLMSILWSGLLVVPFIWEKVLKGYDRWDIVLVFLYVLFSFLCTALEGYYIYRERVYISNRFSVLVSIGVSLAIIALFLVERISFFSYVFIVVIEFIILDFLLMNKVDIKYSPMLNISFLKREIIYGNVIFWASLFGTLIYRVDQIMVEKINGKQLLGIYSIGVSLAELLFLLPNSFGTALTGKILNVDDETQYKVVCKTAKFCLYGCLFMGIVGFLMAPLIKVVYGGEYSRAIRSFRILLIGVCGASIAKVFFNYYISIGKPKVHLYTTMVCFLTNFVLDIIMIPKYEIEGAAIASTLSYLLYGFIYLMLFRYKEHIPYSEMLVIKKEELVYLINRLAKR